MTTSILLPMKLTYWSSFKSVLGYPLAIIQPETGRVCEISHTEFPRPAEAPCPRVAPEQREPPQSDRKRHRTVTSSVLAVHGADAHFQPIAKGKAFSSRPRSRRAGDGSWPA